MVTILHTADVHLDRAFGGIGMTAGIAAARRQELRDAFRRFVDLALESGVDAVTIGGDLYEHERSTLDTGNFLRSQFERLGSVPVLIAPGNHDPYVPDSLYKRVQWPPNVVVFTEPRFRSHSLGEWTVWGAGHDAPDLRQNLCEGFRVPAEGRHLMLFHGSDLRAVPEGKPVHCAFRLEDIERSGAEFALLGHYHGARLHPEERSRFAYPGSPEPLDFSEQGPHYVLRLHLADEGARPELVPFGDVRYLTHRLDVSAMTSSEDLRAGVTSFEDATAIARVILEGRLLPEIDLDVRSLYNACAERFRFLDLVDRTEAAWDLEAMAEESTTKGAFVRLMRGRIAASSVDEADVVRLALEFGLQAFEKREVRV